MERHDHTTSISVLDWITWWFCALKLVLYNINKSLRRYKTLLLLLHDIWCWSLYLSTISCLIYFQYCLIYLHAMMLNCLAISVYVIFCLSSLSSFFLSHHFSVDPFSWHVKSMWIVYLWWKWSILFICWFISCPQYSLHSVQAFSTFICRTMSQ